MGAMRALVVVVAACSVSDPPPSRPPPLAPLPPPAHVETDRFRDAEACGQCHLVDDTTAVLHDATGANVAPVLLWRSSLMALAARDPYYLSVFAEELARTTNAAQVNATCTRCHGPAGAEESTNTLTFDDLTAGSGSAAILARGGVTCTLCHQIDAANLGDDSSFTGKFVVNYGRKIYGRYADPMTNPMMLIVNYTPTQGDHIESSALCATCHTVKIGAVQEQATFLEWRSSQYAPNQPCQSCHVPTVDDANHAISTPIASFPSGLGARTPFGKHVFVGGNSYVLSLIADAIDWSGANIPATEVTASAARDDAHLQTAAKLSITDAHREGDTLVVTVRVENLTGHKLPTGYPSRRMWLHVTAGSFESGAEPLAPQPHRDVIDAPDQAQIWEAILVDSAGNPTHRSLGAAGYSKDDRILPLGYAPSVADAPRTRPVGTDDDASFVPGRDDVTYRIAGAPAGAQITVELLFESIRPDIVDAVDASATPAATRFVDLARARPVTPVVLATTAMAAP
jgi:nitrate/TMAO reductase-like tetraheme cytochrome c subunit